MPNAHRIGKSIPQKSLQRLSKPNVRHSHSSRKVTILGVPFSEGQPRPGVDEAPQALRKAGLAGKLHDLGFQVTDAGDLEFEVFENDPKTANVHNPLTVGAAGRLISDAVYKAVDSGNICLTLGGDHSLSLSAIHGHSKADPSIKIIWVDAHADINPPQCSTSGNLHGMPLSFVVKELEKYMPKVPGFEWIKPCISAKDIAYIGLRDIDPAEAFIINDLRIPCYTMQEVDKYGIATVLDMALHDIDPSRTKPIHLSYDIDAMDPYLTPSTGTPVSGGLTLREGLYIAEEVAATGRLSALDMVEVNPTIGNMEDRKRTVAMAIEIIEACFGKLRAGWYPLGYSIPMPED